MARPNGQPADESPVYTRVLLQHGQIEPPVMLSWPSRGLAPIAMVTCPRCGWRTSRRARVWRTSNGRKLSTARFECHPPGCGRMFTVFDWHPAGDWS